jgi:Uncharacterized protein conserved in bacteria
LYFGHYEGRYGICPYVDGDMEFVYNAHDNRITDINGRLLWQRSCRPWRLRIETVILPRDKNLNTNSRYLRNNMTRQEKHLWYDFLKSQSHQFYRQRIIGDYIADFYCPAAKLVIELDGSQHYENKALEYDAIRTEYMNSLGLKVLRFTNIDVDKSFIDVCTNIEQTILSQLALTAPLPKEPEMV